ncbi:PspC domain-containing protein [Corynebacterium capitovis]|nr:PspC domain-containing protein [Corynebacterium capitovis]
MAGVCGGIAQRFKIDSTLVRLVFAALALAGVVPGVLLYIVAWIIMPEGV